MCGIVGIYDRTSATRVDPDTIRAMAAAIRHRGPDHSAIFTAGSIGLGYVRLSILDLSESGNQPMADATGDYIAVYNGEVYNFPELRRDLERQGVHFRSTTDTEVVVNLFAREGIAGVQKLNGMFAFAVWSKRSQELWMFRDPIGIKPLYYRLINGRLIFASETKAIRIAEDDVPEIDPQGLLNYLSYGHAVAPRTIHKGISKLPPGFYLRATSDRLEIESYWEFPVPSRQNSSNAGVGELVEECESVLHAAVKHQMVADVPVGVFLSGGIDSSLVTAFMAQHTTKLKSFSVAFPQHRGYDETSDARLVARHFGTDHHEVDLTEADVINAVDTLVYHYDEPFADAAGLPLYVLSRFARQQVKVALSGDGGDELFGGYRRYAAERFWSYYQKLPGALHSMAISTASLFGRARRVNRLVKTLKIPNAAERYAGWLQIFSRERLSELLSDDYQAELATFDPAAVYRDLFQKCSGAGTIQRVCYADSQTWLPDTYLEKVDKASMAVSLEVRVPILDLNVVRFAASVPDRLRIRGFSTKYLLRQVAKRHLPDAIVRKPKHGFAVPVDAWIRGKLKDYMREILLDSRALRRGFFRPGAIEAVFNRHASGKENCDTQIWTLLMLELWMQASMDRNMTPARLSAR
jgi:asparagine synthase (glutamine-hydrolysing)